MKSLPQQTIDNIIKLGWAEVLRQDGYYRHGRYWYQRGEGFMRSVNVQSSTYNSGAHGRFTINLGVNFQALALATGTKFKGALPKQYDFVVGERIGFVLPEKNDKWWEFNEGSDLQAIADELVEAWRRYGKPWLERFSDPRILPTLREEAILHKRYAQALQVSVTLGETEAARHWLEQVLIEYPVGAYKHFLKWAEERGISLQQEDLPKA
jgi:hypothetical protein